MPTNLLTEIHVVEAELNKTISKIERRQKSPLGKLPIIRSKLKSRQIELDYNRMRIEAAKHYLNAIS